MTIQIPWMTIQITPFMKNIVDGNQNSQLIKAVVSMLTDEYVLFCLFFSLNRRQTNKGIGIEVIHYLNDGLWQMKQLEKW